MTYNQKLAAKMASLFDLSSMLQSDLEKWNKDFIILYNDDNAYESGIVQEAQAMEDKDIPALDKHITTLVGILKGTGAVKIGTQDQTYKIEGQEPAEKLTPEAEKHLMNNANEALADMPNIEDTTEPPQAEPDKKKEAMAESRENLENLLTVLNEHEHNIGEQIASLDRNILSIEKELVEILSNYKAVMEDIKGQVRASVQLANP